MSKKTESLPKDLQYRYTPKGLKLFRSLSSNNLLDQKPFHITRDGNKDVYILQKNNLVHEFILIYEKQDYASYFRAGIDISVRNMFNMPHILKIQYSANVQRLYKMDSFVIRR